MKTEPNDNAFPCEYDCSHNAQKESVQGLTKREYLIFQIYSKSIASDIATPNGLNVETAINVAIESRRAADILFDEL